MSIGRHAYVNFYPADWRSGTAYLSSVHRLIYFDLCCYMWDKNEPVPECLLPMMFPDIPDFRDHIEALIAARKIMRDENGYLFNLRALSEASKSFRAWAAMSSGGKKGRAKQAGKLPRKLPAKPPVKEDLVGSGSGSGSGSSLPVSKRDTPITHDDLGNVIKLNGGKA